VSVPPARRLGTAIPGLASALRSRRAAAAP
jgi:hypothetical protein